MENRLRRYGRKAENGKEKDSLWQSMLPIGYLM
jgi:hypothetical protein